MTEEFIDDILANPTQITVPITDDTILTSSEEATKEPTSVEDKSKKPENSGISSNNQEDSQKNENKVLNHGTKEASTAADEPPSQVTIEALAKQLGWNSEHQGESYVDAATYILRGRDIQDSMKTHNKELKGQLADMKSSIDALQEHNERVYKTEVSRLKSELDALQTEKINAIELGDVAKVNALDAQIDTVKQNLSVPEVKPQRTNNPVYDDWVAENQWYVTDPDMATYANQIAQQYVGAPADRIYKAVRSKVEELWPEKFVKTPQPVTTTPLQQAITGVQSVNATQQPGQISQPAQVTNQKPVGPTGPVESGHQNATAQIFTKAELTDSQKSIMQQFTRLGIMTEDQYISDIAKLQGD